ncbi:cation diffusion facilitator family transporter [Streptomyces sp. NBC_00344]|uniref:cation diffusion facilitator family transporter n=1 Tax=Streptomyces sp. NBC_00344 TaxID=2975720 RepID=UPI002E217232
MSSQPSEDRNSDSSMKPDSSNHPDDSQGPGDGNTPEEVSPAKSSPGDGSDGEDPGKGSDGESTDQKTKVTVLVALAANLVIALAKAIGGVFAGSPALLSEAAHSVADSLNEVFLLFALRRSKRPADRRHPFGYGKERFFWALLAAVGIFVMGGCFSFLQGIEALRGGNEQETTTGYIVGLIVLGVALIAEGTSLLRAVIQVRGQGGLGKDPALRTVIAEDSTAVLGVLLAMGGMALHMVTKQIVWEASASIGIGLLLVYVAYRLGKDARDQLIGEAADPELRDRIEDMLNEQPEIDVVSSLLTMRLGMDSTLVAARIDLVPGLESEQLELVSMRIKSAIAKTWPEADQVYLDVTDAARAAAGDTP